MTGLKITVQVCDRDATVADQHVVTTGVRITSHAPFSIVVANDNTKGISIEMLKALLNIAASGKLSTALITDLLHDSVVASIISGQVDLVDPLLTY